MEASPPALSLSVVVVAYNMRREVPRTLRSLMPGYQRGANPADYEVLVVENGSSAPLDAGAVAACGPNFRHLPFAGATPSPAGAVNFGIRQARGALVAVMIDGARLASPGLIAAALAAARTHPRPVIATLSWHLGPSSQQRSALEGYNQAREDALLAAIGWPEGDGYRLYEIAAPGHSAREGIFRVPGESNFLAVPRAALLDELGGGCDERFNLPGGGLVNHDLFRRACGLPESELIVLLGEGTFHQLHGGVSTNPAAAEQEHAAQGKRWQDQYRELHGGEWFARSRRAPRFWGHIPPALLPAAEWSARLAETLGSLPPGQTASAELRRAASVDYLAAQAARQRRLLGLAEEPAANPVDPVPAPPAPTLRRPRWLPSFSKRGPTG